MERAPVRLRDSISAVLLILLIFVSSQRLYSTNWTKNLGTVLLLALLGSILGVFLGNSKFKGGIAGLGGVIYSIIFVPLILLDRLYQNIPWLERLMSLGGQLAFSTVQLVTSRPVDDPTLFIVFAAVVYWIVGLTAGYTLMRSAKFAAAVVPAGIILFVVQLFDMQVGEHFYVLAVYAILALLLLGRLTYVQNRRDWKEKRVWVSAESLTDLNILFSAAALALVFVVWVAPVSGRAVTSARVYWENLTRPWRSQQETLNNSIKSLRSSQVNTLEFYGATLGLGQQAETGTDTYLRIRVPIYAQAERYYWRVRTYDDYQNGQWQTQYTYDEPFRPAEGSLAVDDPQGTTGEFVFTVPNQNLNLVATPQRPIWISRPGRLTFTPSAPGRVDPLMFEVSPTLMAGGEYIVHSIIYDPTIAQLSSAGTDYPAWVSDHYLELPADLPAEIRQLALQITAGDVTPYDKAAAITDYLRKNITYSTTVQIPPQGKDSLSWFLFVTKSGFCNYYATAEVVMLRSLGIPARMAVGFAQGEFESPNFYTVRQRDSHAWPEVYFPDSGWIQFEPTVNQAPLTRQKGDLSALGTPTPNAEGTPEGNLLQTPQGPGAGKGLGRGILSNTFLRLTLLLLGLIALMVAGFFAYSFGVFDRWSAALGKALKRPPPVLLRNSLLNLGLAPPAWLVRWATLAELTPVERSFAEVYRSLRRLGIKTSSAKTPSEAAAELKLQLPTSVPEIETLLQQAERSLFGKEEPDLGISRQASQKLRRTALKAAIRKRWKKLGSLGQSG